MSPKALTGKGEIINKHTLIVLDIFLKTHVYL